MLKDFRVYKEEGIKNINLTDGVNPDGIAALGDNPEGNRGGGANPDNPGSNGDSNTNNLDSLSDDVKSIATELGGTKFDTNGNLVDNDGKIIKVKEEFDNIVKEKLQPQEEVIKIVDAEGNEKEYKVDENGNALNEDGTVFKTKEQLEAEFDDSDGPAASGIIDIKAVEEKSGVKVLDENGNPKVFEGTIEGLANRDAAIVAQTKAQTKLEAQQEFLQNNPDIMDVVAYKRMNGSLEGYGNYIDFSKVTIEKGNEEQQFNLVVEAESKIHGRTLEEAKEQATILKDANKLENAAAKALVKLKDAQAKAIADANTKSEQDAANEKKRITDYWIEVNSIVTTKDEIAGVAVPKVIQVKAKDGSIKNLTREDIFTYMSKPVKQDSLGSLYAQYDIDLISAKQNRTVEHDILDVIRHLTGNDFSSIIKENVQKEKIKAIKTYKQKSNSNSGTPNTDGKEMKGVGNVKL